MLLTSAFAVTAAEMVATSDAVVETENELPEELVPMMAMRCVGAYPDYPGNDGFLGDYQVVTLPAGRVLWQYRRSNEMNQSSRFYCMPNTDPDVLALPPTEDGITYIYKVVILPEPTTFHVGTVAPWGNCYNGWNGGGGTQYVIPN